jgi:hypothetical protein
MVRLLPFRQLGTPKRFKVNPRMATGARCSGELTVIGDVVCNPLIRQALWLKSEILRRACLNGIPVSRLRK